LNSFRTDKLLIGREISIEYDYINTEANVKLWYKLSGL